MGRIVARFGSLVPWEVLLEFPAVSLFGHSFECVVDFSSTGPLPQRASARMAWVWGGPSWLRRESAVKKGVFLKSIEVGVRSGNSAIVILSPNIKPLDQC